MSVTTNLGLTILGGERLQPEVIIDANMQLLDALVSGGTSFPGTPATNRRFFRSDRNIEYFYNGTRWLSTQLFVDPIDGGPTALLPYAATIAANATNLAVPYATTYDLWLEAWHVVFLVVTGGTALSGSHKWVSVLSKTAGSTPTTVSTVNIDSGASGTFRTSVVAIGALLGTTHTVLSIGHTKTGTPGALYFLSRIVYRLVG